MFLYIWIFCGIALVNIYIGFLVATISTYEAAPPFTDMKTLAEQKEYIYGIRPGSAFTTWVEVSYIEISLQAPGNKGKIWSGPWGGAPTGINNI